MTHYSYSPWSSILGPCWFSLYLLGLDNLFGFGDDNLTIDSTTNLVTTNCLLAGQAVVVVVVSEEVETEMSDVGLGQGTLGG
jgi:hypothetical protein